MQDLIDESYRKIGENVHRFRVVQRMTQEMLAEKSKLTVTYISQIERADLYKGITCTAMFQIAEALNVPVCVLLTQKPCQKYLECLSGITSTMSLDIESKNQS